LLSNVTSTRWLRVEEDDVELFAKMYHNFDDLRVLDVERGEFFVLQFGSLNPNASSTYHNLLDMMIINWYILTRHNKTYLFFRIEFVGSNTHCPAGEAGGDLGFILTEFRDIFAVKVVCNQKRTISKCVE
jgi:hypothetical protein